MSSNITKFIQDLINDNNLEVIITEDFQRYETFKRDADNIQYTPAVITRLNDSAIVDYSDVGVSIYRIYFYLKLEDKVGFTKVFDELSQQQYNYENGYIRLSPLYINDLKLSNDGNDELRVDGYINVTYEFIKDYILTGNQVKLTLDGEELLFKRIYINNDKALISNLPDNSGVNNPKLTNTTIGVDFNYVKGSREELLLYEALNSEVNKVYKLGITIGSYEHLFNVYIRNGNIDLSNTLSPTSFNVRFETILPRVSIKLDSETIPLISYSFDMSKGIETLPFREGEYFVQKSHPSTIGYAINASFVMDDTGLTKKLIDDIHTNKGFYNKYQIAITLLGEESKFDVLMSAGSYSMTETGELFFNCSFVEAGD